MWISRALTGAGVLLLLAVTPVSAQRDGGLPSSFDHVGVIDRVDAANDAIIVGDGYLRLSPDTVIHGRDGEVLRTGMRVGIALERAGNRRIVSGIWVLPRDYEPENGERED